jgi:hypothetical protein
MAADKKNLTLLRDWVVLVSIGIVVSIVIIVGLKISGGFINKSRLSVAMQTVKGISSVMAGCQINNLPIIAPDDAKNPKNIPCLQTNEYATLDRNATKNCLYNTTFVTTVSQLAVAGGAIQAGCDCAGDDISTCKTVFQCDFATTGQCSTKIIEK